MVFSPPNVAKMLSLGMWRIEIRIYSDSACVYFNIDVNSMHVHSGDDDQWFLMFDAERFVKVQLIEIQNDMLNGYFLDRHILPERMTKKNTNNIISS